MSAPAATEADVLQSLLPQYEAEGFQVYVNPSPSILPSFLQSYRPDAIALRGDKRIVIEVIRSTQSSAEKVQRLQSLFPPKSGWELRVIYVSPLSDDRTLDIASYRSIDEAIERVSDLKRDGHFLPALVMAWATLEAIGRALLPERFRRPQTPGRLVEVLASEGYLTPHEADALRPAITVRNMAVHGGLESKVDEKQLEQHISVLRTLAGHLPTDTAGAQ
jgi:uncharacterized protein YutE (UPF0331/DUF86 family)